MKRPIGIILTAVVLALFALAQLLVAAGLAIGAIGVHLKPASLGPSPLPPGVALVVFLAMASFFGGLAAWAIATIIGLLQLRNWGRISTIVIGASLVVVCAPAVLFAVIFLFVGPITTTPPNVPPHTMQIILGITAVLYGVLAAIGVWWLIYFNQAPVKALFAPRPRYDPNNPIGMLPLTQRKPGRFAHVPTAITILACLSLISAVFCFILALVPLPAFLLGFILTRPVSSIVYVTLAIASALVGIGLLRLDNRARIAFIAFLALGAVNVSLSLLPWYQAQFRLYMQQFTDHMRFPGMPPTTPYYSGPFIILNSIFALVIYGVVFWFLQRHRNAFLASPPPPQP